MRPKLKTVLLAAMLLVCVGLAVAWGQQSPQSEPQPQANQPSHEKTAPQTESQPAAPNPATPQAPAAKDQTPEEQPPTNAQPPVVPKERAPAAPSKTPSNGSGGVRKKNSAKGSSAQEHHTTRRHKSVTAPSGKVVVRNGGVKDDSIQLSPAGNQQQDSHDRQNMDQLLATADDNLKRVAGQQLTEAQRSTVDQIRTYMRQAKSAADAGDLARAYTLALKAHLLSVDLTKH